MRILSFVLFTSLLASCASSEAPVSLLNIPTESTPQNILIVAGEGGPSGALFSLAARSYQREHGGEIVELHNGDEFVSSVENFVAAHGPIDHMEFFSHGNEVGLFVNQDPGVHGGIYAYDPAQVADFSAASIYELPSDSFAPGGTIQFNGCNAARGYPEKNTLAQSFSNHFHVDVEAPLGPMEFSLDPGGQSLVSDMKALAPGYSGDIYMVPTYADQGLVQVTPQATAYFDDLYIGQSYYEGAAALLDRGLSLDFSHGFAAYKNISGSEALVFCQSAFGDACSTDYASDEFIRNLYALKMLVDAAGVSLSPTDPWRDSYIRWASSQNLLTDNFTSRKWFTRGEMAELTWNILNAADPALQ